MDTQLEERLKHDLFDVTRDVEAPVGFVHDALRSGRRLRRRRTSVLLAAGVAAVAAGVLLVPGLGTGRGDVATESSPLVGWADSLPEGPAPAQPFFTTAGLRDGDTLVEVSPRVDTSRPPQRVSRGWLVMLRTDAPEVAPAVLFDDGSLIPLPAYPDPEGGGTSAAFVAPEGDKVAYGDRVVDTTHNLDTSAIPHDPALVEESDPAFGTSLQISGWTDEGLVYSGAPTVEGRGTEWLLTPDGSTTRLGVPEAPVRSSGGGTAGLALTYDSSRGADTCTTAYAVLKGEWVEGSTGCMGRRLGESLDLSPDGHWLLTDDLPGVWDVLEGAWVAVDVPAKLLTGSVDDWMSTVGWESDDTFLLPVTSGAGASQVVQVVRCSMSTTSCERAGGRYDVASATDQMGMRGPAVTFSDY